MSELWFGVNVSPSAARVADPVADARRAEELGYDFVSVNDHLHGTASRHETWTLLTWIAAATSRIRVATRVLAVPYRNPAVLAKMAETLQRLSGGRLILGLGGGYANDEFRAFGLQARTPRDKVDGMEEAIRIARGLWTEPAFSFKGRLYRTEDARVEPKPDQAIPIWLGTYGDRALAVTGRLADGWIPTLESAPPETIPALRNRIVEAAKAAGRDPDRIRCVYNLDIRVDDRAGQETGVVSGPPDKIVERLRRFLRLGFTAINFCPVESAQADLAEQTERLALEILPAVRAS
jgi:probable F420-dependent oxidoreductase